MAGVCAVYAGMHMYMCAFECVCVMAVNVCALYIWGEPLFFGKALDFHDLACHNLHQVF